MLWKERIDNARADGRFTSMDHCLAVKWVTCKVGEERTARPHVLGLRPSEPVSASSTWPQDDVLNELGLQFWVAVESDDVDQAEAIHDAIERRAVELEALEKGAV